MKLKFHLSVYFVPLRSLSRVASDYSSYSVICIGILRPLREIKIMAIVLHAKSAEFYSLLPDANIFPIKYQ